MDPLMVAKAEHRRDNWLAVLVALLGVTGFCLLLSTSRLMYTETLPWLSLAACIAGVCLFSTVLSKYSAARAQVVTIRNPEAAGDSALPEHMMGDPRLLQMANGNEQVVRLLQVVAQYSENLLPRTDKFTFDDDKNLEGYEFYSVVPGYLASNGVQNGLHDKLTTSMGPGWSVDFNAAEDTLMGTRKSDVPKLAVPEMWQVVHSKEEAARNFDNIAITVGLGANGPIMFPPKLFPHRELTGSTGGGKSVSARAEIMQYLAFGYRIFAVDGKNTDYASFFRVPNFAAISTTIHEHILVIHMVYEILQSRRRTGSTAAKQGDNSWRETMTPVLLVLDEWASVRSQMKSMLSTKELALVDNELVNILKVGREFRVNVLLATQDMKADTVPSDWQDMFIAVASAGRPAPMTVRKAFPEEIQGKVSRIGSTISRKTPGRSLISVVDEDTGGVSAELYQAFWSYSPAETITDKLPAIVKENWTQFKSEVVDRIPKLYPRQWAKLEYPEYREKDPYRDFRDTGWVDLSKMKVEDIHKLEVVALEDQNNGFAYIEDNAQYDPLSEIYLGNEPLDEGSAVTVIE